MSLSPPSSRFPSQRTIRMVTFMEEGQRCDRTLLRWLDKTPKHLIQKWIRKGAVAVNGLRARPEQRLNLGDEIQCPCPLPEVPEAAPRNLSSSPGRNLQKLLLNLQLHYEDEDILVLEKPAGCPAHSGSQHPWGLLEALKLQKPEWKSMALAHRIDKVTSGLLLCAKHALAARRLHEQFRWHRVVKLYHALVHNQTPLTFEVEAKVQKMGEPAKSALTCFQSHRRWKQTTLLRAQPQTGRHHQIRKHLAELGFAILGDRIYESAAQRAEAYRRPLVQQLPKEAIFLHASGLQFEHPVTAQPIRLESPLPPYWAAACSCLDGNLEV